VQRMRPAHKHVVVSFDKDIWKGSLFTLYPALAATVPSFAAIENNRKASKQKRAMRVAALPL